MLKKLRKVLDLSSTEILYLLPALFFLSFAKLAILILPIGFLQQKFQKITSKNNLKEANPTEFELKAKSINRIAYAFTLLGFTCLPKALAMKFWLKNYKDIRVNFGVQKDNQNQLIAHAWVSNNHKIILGEDPNINYKSIWIWG
jgi:Transglutaminase-like superfamily